MRVPDELQEVVERHLLDWESWCGHLLRLLSGVPIEVSQECDLAQLHQVVAGVGDFSGDLARQLGRFREAFLDCDQEIRQRNEVAFTELLRAFDLRSQESLQLGFVEFDLGRLSLNGLIPSSIVPSVVYFHGG